MKQFKNIMDFLKVFASEEICHNFLKDVLWGKKENGKRVKIYCPRCVSNHINEFADFKRNRCYDCKKTFSVRVGTIFDDSKIKLQQWFMAIYLINSNKKGVPSTYIAKEIGVTQKTAWFMLSRIREACKDESFDLPFDGIAEIDEAYLDSKEGNKHSHKKSLAEKTLVLGFVNRDTEKAKAMKHINKYLNEYSKKYNTKDLTNAEYFYNLKILTTK